MRFLANDDGVHVSNPLGSYTLCGDTIEHDPGCPEISRMREVPPQRITCVKCREIVAWCSKVQAATKRGVKRKAAEAGGGN